MVENKRKIPKIQHSANNIHKNGEKWAKKRKKPGKSHFLIRMRYILNKDPTVCFGWMTKKIPFGARKRMTTPNGFVIMAV